MNSIQHQVNHKTLLVWRDSNWIVRKKGCSMTTQPLRPLRFERKSWSANIICRIGPRNGVEQSSHFCILRSRLARFILFFAYLKHSNLLRKTDLCERSFLCICVFIIDGRNVKFKKYFLTYEKYLNYFNQVGTSSNYNAHELKCERHACQRMRKEGYARARRVRERDEKV